MPSANKIHNLLKKVIFGDTLLPQEFTVPLIAPQKEITVWLHGLGVPRDVTYCQSTVCSAPFIICIAFDTIQAPDKQNLERLSLKFCESDGHGQVLGEIGLRLTNRVSLSDLTLFFFEARSSANYCLSRIRLGSHYLLQAYTTKHQVNTSGMKMSFVERRAAMVSFIRPHPTSIVSVNDEVGGNIFIMNLMGDLGNNYFAFALKSTRKPAHLVERTGRIALSSVPFHEGKTAFQLAANHFKESIEWDQLPFATMRSRIFDIPVPDFALRVREMKVELIHKIGSHTLFVARVVSNQTFSVGEELHVVHGFYQARRLKESGATLKASLAMDSLNKSGSRSV
ncbi:flavin reductase [Granulicella sp. dw_53]|uniref:flavin reductase n=1 Tax=Granulicella sp. dw_53 TaxID=2719792 RepID=UPI001BD338DD|nr:flavin reductase [Granulicella sp. dw_53]